LADLDPFGRYGPVVRQVLRWLTVGIAALAFLLFVARLRDTKSSSVRPKVTAPSVPDAGITRDGELSLTLVEREPNAPNDKGDAGATVPDKPIANARVHVFWQQDREYFDAGSARSDGKGKAVLRSLPRGVLWVLAEGDGYARTSSQLVIEGEKRELTLALEPAHSLEVSVTDEQSQPLKHRFGNGPRPTSIRCTYRSGCRGSVPTARKSAVDRQGICTRLRIRHTRWYF